MIDLVVLDPNNPRSVAYQLGRIEAHLAALAEAQRRRPAVAAASRSPTALATQMRTADAAALDDATFARHRSVR